MIIENRMCRYCIFTLRILYNLCANRILSKKPDLTLARKTGQSFAGNASLFLADNNGSAVRRKFC